MESRNAIQTLVSVKLKRQRKKLWLILKNRLEALRKTKEEKLISPDGEFDETTNLNWRIQDDSVSLCLGVENGSRRRAIVLTQRHGEHRGTEKIYFSSSGPRPIQPRLQKKYNIPIATTIINPQTAKYPYLECSSGIYSKFIP